jgi:LysR family transcriptional regulator, low CO2-responsive transcriptional regulator
VTPTQLRAFVAVARLGSVRQAAVELDVTEAAVSLLISSLRKELDDRLFVRTGSGLAFTPGGLRLASRAAEILGLQDQTVREVSQAGLGRRLLRVAATGLFAEHAAPGLIELFANRARDLDVELSVRQVSDFPTLLTSRAVDVAIGPNSAQSPENLTQKPFLNYQIVAVSRPGHRLAVHTPTPAKLREQVWLLGPAAASDEGAVPRILRHFAVPESRQRIFQSDAAALEETQRTDGISLTLHSAVTDDLAQGRLVRIEGPGLVAQGTWSAMALRPPAAPPATEELLRFVTTPRATQAMLRGSGVNIGHFKPSIHVTLWS